jgi:hypothetical protein
MMLRVKDATRKEWERARELCEAARTGDEVGVRVLLAEGAEALPSPSGSNAVRVELGASSRR